MTKKVTINLDEVEEQVEKKEVEFKDMYFSIRDNGSYIEDHDTFEDAEKHAQERAVQHGKHFILKAVASVNLKPDVKFFETERFV